MSLVVPMQMVWWPHFEQGQTGVMAVVDGEPAWFPVDGHMDGRMINPSPRHLYVDPDIPNVWFLGNPPEARHPSTWVPRHPQSFQVRRWN